jgi:hypothetical protein
MAVDIRCVVSCSLGTVISGSVNDDYVQGTGLIKCTGSVVINGIITPAIGTAVTISYTKGGTTRTIPRKLRVLSSFADPFRGTTAVELGCKLTYLQDLKEKIDWTAFNDASTTMTAQDALVVTVPIRAQAVAAKCLTELGLTASGLTLSNFFSLEKFDFSPGYVQVLSDLLVSESKCGYLNASEVLQVFSLDQAGGTGPALDATQLIDISKIGVGQLPGEAVTVSYSTLKLKSEVQTSPTGPGWDTQTNTSAYTVSISYASETTNQQFLQEYNILDTTTISTQYQTITTPDGQSLRVARQVVTTYSSQAPAHLGNAYSAFLSAGLPAPSVPISKTTTETYSYDAEGNETLMSREVIGSAAFLIGSVSIPFTFGDGSSVSIGTGGGVVLERETRATVTVGNSQQVTTTLYGAWHKSQAGQIAIAEGRLSFNTATQAASYINALTSSSGNYIIDTRVETVTRQQPLTAPTQADVNNANNAKGGTANSGLRQESKAQLALAVGSATAQRRIEFSMPYSPDDYFVVAGGIYGTSGGFAEQKALQYGRVQNRLLLGNRNGMNIQLAPELLPAAPFAPFTITAKGATAQYRTNGTSWTFDASGMVVSTDALFWGGVGGTFASRWFPVAPGITSLPTTPAVVDGQMTVSAVVPVVNETVVTEARLRVGCDVQGLAYPLELLSVVPAIGVRTLVQAAKIRKVEAPAASVTIAAATPAVATGASVAAPVATVAIGRLVPVVVSGAGVSVPATVVTVDWLEPVEAGKPRTSVRPPAGTVEIGRLVPVVVSGAGVSVPAGGVTVAGVAPLSVGFKDLDFSSVSLLLHMNGSNGSTTFTDSSSAARTVTANGNAQISTAQSKFGGASGLFDGNGDYLTLAYNSALDLIGNSFTIECWIRVSAFKASGSRIAAAGGGTVAFNSTTGIHWLFQVGPSGNIQLQWRNGTASASITTTAAVSLNTWTHVAACFDNTNVYVSAGGTVTSAAATFARPSTNPSIAIATIPGESGNSGTALNGYIDDLRITKGIARYTANFTPATTAFPDA